MLKESIKPFFPNFSVNGDGDEWQGTTRLPYAAGGWHVQYGLTWTCSATRQRAAVEIIFALINETRYNFTRLIKM